MLEQGGSQSHSSFELTLKRVKCKKSIIAQSAGKVNSYSADLQKLNSVRYAITLELDAHYPRLKARTRKASGERSTEKLCQKTRIILFGEELS